ncbi:hypothetical protein V8C42DRAFT_361858 [Trichoderma barbatum]
MEKLNGIKHAYHAYHRIGATTGTPLLFLDQFKSTMDHLDPLLIDTIAARRHLNLNNYPSAGRSTGQLTSTTRQMAADVYAFLIRIGITEIEVLGFGIGRMETQLVGLDAPSTIHLWKLIPYGIGPSARPEIERIYERGVGRYGEGHVKFLSDGLIDGGDGIIARSSSIPRSFTPKTSQGLIGSYTGSSSQRSCGFFLSIGRGLVVPHSGSPNQELGRPREEGPYPSGADGTQPLTPDTAIELRICLKQGNIAHFEELAKQISHPKSKKYGQHLTAQQVIELFAAPKEIMLETFNTTAAVAEKLVPEAIQPNIDLIISMIHLDTRGLPSSKGGRRSRNAFNLKRQSAKATPSPDSLENCGAAMTPASLRAEDGLPDSGEAVEGNSRGIVQSAPRGFDQEDLDLFYRTLAPSVPNNTGAII